MEILEVGRYGRGGFWIWVKYFVGRIGRGKVEENGRKKFIGGGRKGFGYCVGLGFEFVLLGI